MNSITWTDALRDEVKKLWAEGYTATQMARMLSEKHSLKLSKNSVIGTVHRMHLPSRQSPIIRSGGEPVPRKSNPRPAAPKNTLPPLVSQAQAVEPLAPMKPVPQPARPTSLSARQCVWPMWANASRPTHDYCKSRAYKWLPYCIEHCKVAYISQEKSAVF